MSLTITFGWWLLPVAATLAAFTWALWERPGDLGGFIPSPAPLFRFVGSLIVTLVLWILYLLAVLVCRS